MHRLRDPITSVKIAAAGALRNVTVAGGADASRLVVASGSTANLISILQEVTPLLNIAHCGIDTIVLR